jgi:hypothetical protein
MLCATIAQGIQDSGSGWPEEPIYLTLEAWKESRQSARNRVDVLSWRSLEEFTLKKTMITVLAGLLLLSAAMPAFAKKHHKHHKHHAQHASQTVR